MPSFERPALTEIIRRDTSDFEYELGSQAPRLPGTVEYAFVRAHAGVAHGLHGRIDRVRRDAFWATSSDEEMVRKAALFGVFQIPANRSTGTLLITATANTPIPLNTVWTRDDGFTYRTTAGVVNPDDDFVFAPAEAVSSGSDGNMFSAIDLSLVEPIAGVDGAVPDQGWKNGADVETTTSLRRRLAQRLANPPKGGGPGDYVRWALGDADEEKVPEAVTAPTGVTRAGEYGKVPQVGNVTVLFMRDGDDDPFPSSGEIAEVKAWIMLFAPIGLPEVDVLAPNPHPINITFSSLTLEPNADEAEVKAAIVQAISNMIRTRAEPPKDDDQVFFKSWINEVVSKVAGEMDHKISTPASDIDLAQWDLVTLGNITWP